MNYAMFTDAIRQNVSALEAAEALGLHPDRHGRCACPIHQGHDRNCKLWPDERGFYCYVCHKGGDVIRLVEDTQSCTFWEAVRWLDSAFGLSLELSDRPGQNRSETAQIASKLKRSKREQDKAIDRMLFDCYVLAGQIQNQYEMDAIQYRPTRPYRDWPERFCDAMKNLPAARELTERLAMEVMENNQ